MVDSIAVKDSERLVRLRSLAAEPDPARKRLLALGVLTDRLLEDGLEPILVGGAALEFYTAGGYTTKDVDLALPTCPEVDAAFADLGFSKEGRYWFHEELDLLFEAPAPAGAALLGQTGLGVSSLPDCRDSGRGASPLGVGAGGDGVISYDKFVAEVKRRRKQRWVEILTSEPPGRAPGRRPRDETQERLLLELDRARLSKRRLTETTGVRRDKAAS
ncbi:MAG: hypothetical protein HY814_08650 [Candidatus Riflebacteria bacterium]|nr:hypothetical protein [Candidatus Riflebacteria bacterium]